MKLNFLFFLFLMLLVIFNIVAAERHLKRDQTVLVNVSAKSDIELLAKAGLQIENVKGRKTWIRVDRDDLKLLQQLGFSYSVEVDPTDIITIDKEDVGHYFTYEELTIRLKELQDRCSHLIQMSSIGQSVKGKELWVLKISDNVLIDEAEPEVKLVSTIHGNEIVGQDLLVRFAEYLCDYYESDVQINQIVNQSEIWIMPNMNPDGTELKQRYNADWIDLNRDFPDIRRRNEVNSPDGRAVETQHMMRFQASRQFVLGATFHGGELVVNYPWDSFKENMPDNELAYYVSRQYAIRNTPMYSSSYYSDGVTNGYDWYSIYGGMQDWSYLWHDCMEITVEVSETKWPSYSKMDDFWQDNYESLIQFTSLANIGVQGLVSDKITGLPIQASILVKGIDKVMNSNLPMGDYYRLLAPGTYEVTFMAEGYENQSVEVVIPDETMPQAIKLDVSLQPL